MNSAAGARQAPSLAPAPAPVPAAAQTVPEALQAPDAAPEVDTTYPPSFVPSNTPWFFNDILVKYYDAHDNGGPRVSKMAFSFTVDMVASTAAHYLQQRTE